MRRLARLAALVVAAGAGHAQTPVPAAGETASAAPPVVRHVTQGRAKTVIENLYRCPEKVSNHRSSAVGTIAAADGTVPYAPCVWRWDGDAPYSAGDARRASID
jgi:hypothetical protein